MLAVKFPNGSMVYFNPKGYGVYDNLLQKAELCAERSGGTIMVENHGCGPRWTPLHRSNNSTSKGK